MKIVFCILYYVLGQYLPDNYTPLFGKLSRCFRKVLCKKFCKSVSNSANINKHVYIGNGKDLIIGNYSGIGSYSRIQNTIMTIQDNVMIGEFFSVLGGGHNYSDKSVPMRLQGTKDKTSLIIDDDVWIGAHVIITSSCNHIGKGSIIGAGSVVTHNVEEYSIVAGNPARMIRKR